MRKLISRLYELLFKSGSSGRNLYLIQREFKFYWQRKTRGFDSSELWNLDTTIAEFVLPRIKEFRLKVNGHPSTLTQEEWDEILLKIEQSFELIVNDTMYDSASERSKCEEGLDLFRK